MVWDRKGANNFMSKYAKIQNDIYSIPPIFKELYKDKKKTKKPLEPILENPSLKKDQKNKSVKTK